MGPDIILAAFTLLGTLANGLDCSFTERCATALCTAMEPAPLRVLFVSSPATPEPATFVIGHPRLFEGTPVTMADMPAMTRMFGDFVFAPGSLTYAVGDFSGYQPADGGAVQMTVGGRIVSVAGDGRATLVSEREGRPGISWITRFSGQCEPRSFG